METLEVRKALLRRCGCEGQMRLYACKRERQAWGTARAGVCLVT